MPLKQYLITLLYTIVFFFPAIGQTPFITELHSSNNHHIWCLSSPVLTPDSGYITATSLNRDSTSSIYDHKIVISKLDSTGVLQWSKSYEASVGLLTQQLISDGTGYLLAVNINYMSGAHLLLMKLDQNGDTLWTRRYPQMITSAALYLRPDGNYISMGDGTSGSSQVRCIDTSGNVLWMTSHINFPDGGGSAAPVGIACSDGGYLYFDQGTVVAKLDSSGNYLWSTPRYDHNNQLIYASCLAEFSDGNYLLVGYTTFQQTAKAYMMKITSSGNILWTKSVTDGTMLTYFLRAKSFSDGTMRIRGYTKPGYIDPACDWMLSIDTAGNILSSQKICDAGGYYYWGADFNESPFGGMMTTGYRLDAVQYNNFSFLVSSHGMTPAGCNISPGPSTVTPMVLTNPQTITFTNVTVPLTPGVDSSLIITQNIFTQGNYCIPTGVEASQETWHIKVFPNPCSGTLHLERAVSQKPSIIDVTDISGKSLLTSEMRDSFITLDVSSLSPGIYFVRMRSNSGIDVTKFVME